MNEWVEFAILMAVALVFAGIGVSVGVRAERANELATCQKATAMAVLYEGEATRCAAHVQELKKRCGR